MLMQMVQAGGLPALTDNERQADVDNPKGYLEFAPAKRLHLDSSWLGEAQGKVVKVVAQLLPHLSPNHDYRILLIQRDLNEVLASQRVMLERIAQGQPARSPEALRREYSRQLRRLRHWLERQPNLQTLLLSYHEVLRNPRQAAEAIARFLELPLDVSAMASAVDATLQRQQGIPSGSGSRAD